MNYWITTQWPLGLTAKEHSGVYLPDGRQMAGSELKPGDVIFVYESKTSRTEIKVDTAGNRYHVKRQPGREGVVALLKAVTPILEDQKAKESMYTDGTKLWWKWCAETKTLRQTGFVSRIKLNRILGNKSNYNFHGFGDKKSGLKKLSEQQFNDIFEAFNSVIPAPLRTPTGSTRKHKWLKAPESLAHKQLKEYVANNPEKALGELGLQTIKVEYDDFDSGDSADILMQDRFGRVIGVEIELSVAMNDISGVLQAIKYRFMGAVMRRLSYNDSRSFLIAHCITQEVKDLCNRYEVQYFEIPASEVCF